MSAETTKRLRELLQETLTLRMPAELRARIEAAIARGPGGPGRSRKLDYDQVRQMVADGKAVADIATELGASRAAVYRVLQDEPIS